jgi:hypothetical protein
MSALILATSASPIGPTRSQHARPTGPAGSRRSPIAGFTRTPAERARYLCSCVGRHGARGDARIGRSDRAAGQALTIQIVANQ